MIIGITGTIAAGKGTIVEFLKRKGFLHYSVRKFLIEEINKRNLEINRDSMVLVANDLRKKNSPSYIIKKLYEKAEIVGGDCILESLRALGEVKELKKKKDFYLFSVDANSFLRYERARKRKSETDNISYKEFLFNEKREFENNDPSKGNLKKCIELSNFHFENNGTIEELKRNVEKVLEKINSKTKKREAISWDEFFMGVTILSSQRSKDPSTQVGACIVDQENKIVATGYNGFPRGCSDKDFNWERRGDFLNVKYPYVCHAELNAILNSTRQTLKGCKIYVDLFPCNECAKAIIQSGVVEVIYLKDKYHDTPAYIASRRLLDAAKIRYRKMQVFLNEIVLSF